MSESIVVNEGEVIIKYNQPTEGKQSLASLGVKASEVATDGGFMRLVFDFEGIGAHSFYAVPTLEIAYSENVGETHWQCDFNGKTIVDKMDHHGKSTVILLKKAELENLEQHHENKLVLHAEFPEAVTIDVENSFVNFFK